MPFVRAECGATTERRATRHDPDDDDQFHRGDAAPRSTTTAAGVEQATNDRLAASIEFLEPAETVPLTAGAQQGERRPYARSGPTPNDGHRRQTPSEPPGEAFPMPATRRCRLASIPGTCKQRRVSSGGRAARPTSARRACLAPSRTIQPVPGKRHRREQVIQQNRPSSACRRGSARTQPAGRRRRTDIAMTGETTLSGNVLRVGGSKEKVLAARRVGVAQVMLPKQNEAQVRDDLDEELRREMAVHYVSTIYEALKLALSPSAQETTARSPVPAAVGALSLGGVRLRHPRSLGSRRGYRAAAHAHPVGGDAGRGAHRGRLVPPGGRRCRAGARRPPYAQGGNVRRCRPPPARGGRGMSGSADRAGAGRLEEGVAGIRAAGRARARRPAGPLPDPWHLHGRARRGTGECIAAAGSGTTAVGRSARACCGTGSFLSTTADARVEAAGTSSRPSAEPTSTPPTATTS